jgi:hypothetical protein
MGTNSNAKKRERHSKVSAAPILKKRVTWRARGALVPLIQYCYQPAIMTKKDLYSMLLLPLIILLIATYFAPTPKMKLMYSDLARISPLSFNHSRPVIQLDYTALSDPQAKRQVYLSSNQDTRVTVENSFREVENGYELTLELWTMVDVELHALKATYWADLTDIKMLANGYQSWSQTRELNEYGRLSKIPYPVAWVTKFDLQG